MSETPEVAGGEREALDLAEITRRLGAADEVVSALCEGRQRWTMSIPADIERDPDIVIARALHDARRMLALLSARPAPERERYVPEWNWANVNLWLAERGYDKRRLAGLSDADLRPEPVSEPERHHGRCSKGVSLAADPRAHRDHACPEYTGEPERAPGATEDGKGTVARKGDEGEARPSGRAPGAEPVAWKVRPRGRPWADGTEGWFLTQRSPESDVYGDEYEIVPLYASPPQETQ